MTYGLMLDWAGGPAVAAATAFEQMIDAPAVPPADPTSSQELTVADKRAALMAGMRARGEDAAAAALT